MSEPDASEQDGDQESPEAVSEEEEVFDAVPVLAGPPRIVAAQSSADRLPGERRTVTVIPAVQAAAVAAGGFVAGAAVVGLVHRRRRRAATLLKGGRARRSLSSAAGSRKDGRAGELLQIVGSRSLLVDVHLLGGNGGDR